MIRGAVMCLCALMFAASCGEATRAVTETSTVPAHPRATGSTARSAPPPPAPPVSAAVIANAKKAMVAIGCPSGGVLSSGSGFKATRFRLIVTAAHVARACPGGASLDIGGERGGVVHLNPKHDIALVDSPSANVGSSLRLATHPAYPGEPVAILGFPGSSGQLVASRGIVLATGRRITSTDAGHRETLPDAIQVIGSVGPGDSGGPVINAHGRVVGVVEIGSDNRRISYLTPAGDVGAEPAGP
jgi:S1-C subfamily serine protease